MASDKEFEDENQDKFNESDETFGLPDIEYEPIKREESTSSSSDSGSSYESSYETSYSDSSYDSGSNYDQTPLENEEFAYTYEEEKSSNPWGTIIIIVLIVAALGGASYWYFFDYRPKQQAEEEALAAKEAKERLEAQREQARLDSLERIRLDREAAIRDSIAAAEATPPVGTIEMLEGRTQRFYAVVASDIDDDLLMDYAKKLSKNGVSSKVIPPFGTVKFYRLAIAEGDTWQEAAAKASDLKSEYGDGVWVIRY